MRIFVSSATGCLMPLIPGHLKLNAELNSLSIWAGAQANCPAGGEVVLTLTVLAVRLAFLPYLTHPV